MAVSTQPSMAMLLVGCDGVSRTTASAAERWLLPAGRAGGRSPGEHPVDALVPWARIEYPIWSVGMGMVAGPELAAAVSNAGGFGVLGTHDLSAKTIQSQVGRALMEHLESQLAAADNSFDNPVLEPARRRLGAS